MPQKFAERRFPLHVHISALFTLLLLFTGVVLGLFNYRQTSQIILSSSDELFGRISQEVETDLQQTYQPIYHLLNLLALGGTNQRLNSFDRLDILLRPLTQALHDNPKLAALYVGYDDGDFFMVRHLRNDMLKKTFNAPLNAVYQVWSIERDNLTRARSLTFFFDGQLNEIVRRQELKERYDPRSRPWFYGALEQDEPITTAPYVFFSSGAVGTTLARPGGSDSVVGADLTLDDLSATLASHRVTPSTEVVLYQPDGRAVAYPDTSKLVKRINGAPELGEVKDFSPPLAALIGLAGQEDLRTSAKIGDRRWVIARQHLAEGGPKGLNLAILAPEDELLDDAYRIRWQGAMLTLAILLLCIPLGILLSRIVVKPLRALVVQAEAIRSFNFSLPAMGRSPVLEVDQLAVSMARMKETISSFLEIASSLSAENRFDNLLRRVLDETIDISEASGGLLYLIDNQKGRLEPHGLFLNDQEQDLEAHGIRGFGLESPAMPHWLDLPSHGGPSQVCSFGYDQAGAYRDLLQTLESPRVHLVSTGLHNRQGITIGVLVLLHRDTGKESRPAILRPERIAFVEAISGVAALCIESQRLLEKQKQLLDAFIQLMAGAIDAKSPYTGGHCQRVPEITLMLARAAAASNETAFRGFQPTDEEWEALHIAAWLHDCGKVTTPEYVVDKATKLETLNDRIHEIRTRFEVLKRDAWVRYWQALAQGADENEQARLRDTELAALDDDFAFIARCNLGGEAMAEADQERLKEVAARTWTRTLDNRLGVSWEEAQRLARTPPQTLPVEENLLADRPDHLFERPATELMPPDNPWGFKLQVPEYKFNRGELHNLSVSRGTLTDEERYIINHHIVQTILMLNHLPFPAHLANVAEIAGGHHEKMDGTGYPKRLTREEMSLPARMMAIADIFEALTAVDRPYKKGKTLSEALGIMTGMCRGAHIDPDLFGLFIRSGVYMDYARRFLKPEQVDAVDEAAMLAKAGLA
ncbi:HAMP domain-containing protein [Metapseudomonas lalkuanensis]|uniref:HAMP domain-containing protein n=1 Tax=Metapseudomonas lalkuanensis TaxID=2604832 RepID=A0A5J6QID8_9GAMM|nr:HD domain-containing phosphohydrolase [Pseudomonas lalkuanensis]QEY62314.1 HAMP domain-containing protein [Pseudomonas lalkuanensis]